MAERIGDRDNVLLECGHISFGYGLLKVLGEIGKLYTHCDKGCVGSGKGPADKLCLVKRKAKPGDYDAATNRPDSGALF